MKAVDSKADMCSLHFPESSFDLVYTSHILEYIKLDCQVINEVKRVPAPGSISFLPVPKVTKCIKEYFEQNLYESNNARAPGNDFFDRHMQGFSRVDIYSSDAFDEKCHLYVYENMIRYTS